MPNDIMDRLKAETAELHDQAERHAFQSHLVKGRLRLDGYVRYLAAMFHIHMALEQALKRAAKRDSVVASLPLESRFREGALRRDLARFGVDVDKTGPLPSVVELVQRVNCLQTDAPAALLGLFYVLEGSTNGTHFIAKAVRRAYGLPDSEGTEYLDPHGVNQRPQWLRFKEQMRAVGFTTIQADGVVSAAKSMFLGIMRVSDELMALENADADQVPDLGRDSTIVHHECPPQAPLSKATASAF